MNVFSAKKDTPLTVGLGFMCTDNVCGIVLDIVCFSLCLARKLEGQRCFIVILSIAMLQSK